MLAQQAIESRVRFLLSGKKKIVKEERALQARELGGLRRALAGAQALMAWADLDEADLSAGHAKALALAALGMIEDGKIKKAAFADLIDSAFLQDKPAVWMFCVERGFDPMGSNAMSMDGWGVWSMTDKTPSSWVGKAIKARAWGCVKMLAGRSDGKAGVPGFDSQGQRVALGVYGALEPWMADLPPRAMKTELEWSSSLWRFNDPTLMGWASSLDGDKFPPAVERALAASGFSARFGEKPFDYAAARLALEGSREALAACRKAKASPAPVVEGMEDVEAFKLLRDHEVFAERRPRGLWEELSEWIDESMGAGSAAKLAESCAFGLLSSAWDAPRWGNAEEEQALDWLALHGCSDGAKAKERLLQLQGWAIERAERQKGGQDEVGGKISRCMEIWSQAQSKPKGRRLLKA